MSKDVNNHSAGSATPLRNLLATTAVNGQPQTQPSKFNRQLEYRLKFYLNRVKFLSQDLPTTEKNWVNEAEVRTILLLRQIHLKRLQLLGECESDSLSSRSVDSNISFEHPESTTDFLQPGNDVSTNCHSDSVVDNMLRHLQEGTNSPTPIHTSEYSARLEKTGEIENFYTKMRSNELMRAVILCLQILLNRVSDKKDSVKKSSSSPILETVYNLPQNTDDSDSVKISASSCYSEFSASSAFVSTHKKKKRTYYHKYATRSSSTLHFTNFDGSENVTEISERPPQSASKVQSYHSVGSRLSSERKQQFAIYARRFLESVSENSITESLVKSSNSRFLESSDGTISISKVIQPRDDDPEGLTNSRTSELMETPEENLSTTDEISSLEQHDDNGTRKEEKVEEEKKENSDEEDSSETWDCETSITNTHHRLPTISERTEVSETTATLDNENSEINSSMNVIDGGSVAPTDSSNAIPVNNVVVDAVDVERSHETLVSLSGIRSIGEKNNISFISEDDSDGSMISTLSSGAPEKSKLTCFANSDCAEQVHLECCEQFDLISQRTLPEVCTSDCAILPAEALLKLAVARED